nr:unnamed protein product [Fasciola hepatica]
MILETALLSGDDRGIEVFEGGKVSEPGNADNIVLLSGAPAKQFQDFPLTLNHLKSEIATYVPSRPVLHDVLSFGDDSEDFLLLDISESVEDSLVHTSPGESVKGTVTEGPVSSNRDEIEDLIIVDDVELVSVIPTTDHQPAPVNLESPRPLKTFLTTKAESVTTKSVSTGPTTKIEELPATQSASSFFCGSLDGFRGTTIFTDGSPIATAA